MNLLLYIAHTNCKHILFSHTNVLLYIKDYLFQDFWVWILMVKNNSVYDMHLKSLDFPPPPFHLTYLFSELEVLCSNLCVLL